MKKKVLFFGLLLAVNVCVFSVDFTISYFDIIRITDTKLYFNAFDGISAYTAEEYDITWENIDGLEYITFNYTGNFMDKYSQSVLNKTISKGPKRYLILYGDPKKGWEFYLLLYDENNELVFAFGEKTAWEWFVPQNALLTATSELAQGNVTYRAQNLLDIKKLLPWAKGARGSGVGEKILIEFNPANPGKLTQATIQRLRFFGILFSNGFVDYKRPHLYKQNNRVKKIRVHFIDAGGYADFDVLDTPQLQYFYFGDRRSAKVQIEILEIYKGERGDDTFISSMFPFSSAW